MAQQTTVRLVDDLDGSEAVESIEFGVDGKVYEIDLNPVNAARLRDTLAPFLSSARKAGNRIAWATGAKWSITRTSSANRAAGHNDSAAVREWARAQGIEVSDRGRIPAHILAGYSSSLIASNGSGDTLNPKGETTPETAPTAVFQPAQPKETPAKRKPVSGTTEPPAPGQSAPTMQAAVAFRESRGLTVPKSKKLSSSVFKATTELMSEAGLL